MLNVAADRQSVEGFLRGGTVQARHLGGVTEPLRLVMLSTRHGIGGAITDNAHLIPIRRALGQVSETHVIGASGLAYENLGVAFHKDCFQQRGSRTPLDPLKIVDPEKVRSIIAQIKPHLVLFLDAPPERPLMTGRPLEPNDFLKMGARCVIAAHEAQPLSGFWALQSVQIASAGSSQIVEVYPHARHESFLQSANVYRESDRLANLFGASGMPTQIVAPTERLEAAQALRNLGVRASDRVIYIHAGTSTPLKEYTPRQLAPLIQRTRHQLKRAHIGLENLFFVVSPEPVDRPETAKAISDTLVRLGGRVVQPPRGNFGLLRGIIANSDAVLCADTAVGHLATALKIPCAILFGNPDPLVPSSMWTPERMRRQNPNTVSAEMFSETSFAKESFGKRAQATLEQKGEADFVLSLILAAAVEGWSRKPY